MSDRGLVISDFDKTAINIHSVLELAGAVVEYLGYMNHPKYEYLRDLYEKLKNEGSGRKGYCGSAGIMKNRDKMELLSKYISGLPVEYLDKVRDKVNGNEVDGFSGAIDFARKFGLKPYIMTMSFDYLVKDSAEKWGCSYDSNKIIVADGKVERIELSIPDEMGKADLFEKIVLEYIKAKGQLPNIHLIGDGESDMLIFKRIIRLMESGCLGRAVIYVPNSGTEEAKKLASYVFPDGELEQCLRKNLEFRPR